MLVLVVFLIALACALINIAYTREWHCPKAAEILLGYVLLFNMGFMSILAAFAHIFMGPETAAQIGWEAGSPFQFEMGVANLSYGVLGVMAFWIRGRFWDAAIIGWSILLLGCFVGHVIDYLVTGNNAPLNIGPYIWAYDLILPLFLLVTLSYIRKRESGTCCK
jgi:hypothetical protein